MAASLMPKGYVFWVARRVFRKVRLDVVFKVPQQRVI